MIKITCDACAREVYDKARHGQAEYARMWAAWGYGTKWDGWSMDYHLCEECVEKVLGLLGLQADPEPKEGA